MASGLGWVKGMAVAATVVAAALLVGTGALASPQEASRTELSSRLRAADAKAASLLQIGLARSATFRMVSDAIEHSDVLVYVEARPMRSPAELHFLAAASGCRHLRVSVRVPDRDADLVAWLAHELWHAAEIAGAPEVVDQSSLLRFYERIGHVSRRNATAETGKAQETWAKVLGEVLYGR
jgi:hypothetical protein